MKTSKANVRGGVVLALCFQACSFELMEPPLVVENSCVGNSDCPGASCEHGMCVAATAPALAVTLEITPTSPAYGAEPAAIVLPPFSLAGADDRVLIVPDPISVVGDVRANGAAIAADLRFVPTLVTAVTQRAISAKTFAEPAVVANGELADYVAPLLADTTYRVRVTPVDRQALPPMALELTANADKVQRLDAVYDPARLVTHTIPISNLPAGSWFATAVDPMTGEAVSTRAPVSSDAPDAVLTFAAMPATFDLVIEPVIEAGAENQAPTFRITHDRLIVLDSDTLRAVLPELGRAVSFIGTVEHCRDLLMEPEVDNRPPMAVALRSRTLLTAAGMQDASASFATTATATYDAAVREWSFSTQVAEGEYDVVVTPATGSGCGVFAERRTIQAPATSNATAAALLQLQTMSSLAGRVRASGQATPVPGASVVANALGLRDAIAFEAADDTVTRYNRSQQTTTDDAGEFTLPIDVGAYDVLIKPPAESGFAWHVMRDVNVGARTDTPFDREIDMAAPVVLRGVLRAASMAAVMDGATIRAYTTTDDAERGQRALPIGVATADGDGGFMLLLPAAIDRGWY